MRSNTFLTFRVPALVLALAGALAVVVPGSPTAVTARAATMPAAAAGAVTWSAQSARTVANGPGFVHAGDAVATFKWMITRATRATPGRRPSPAPPAACHPARRAAAPTRTSPTPARGPPSATPTAGPTSSRRATRATSATTTALPNVPAGRYLISVTADGFKIDGAHFTVDGDTHVVVRMNRTPLPLATLRIQAFQDQIPVDATYEADAERGLQCFTAHLCDVLGEVSTDYYGNAIRTA